MVMFKDKGSEALEELMNETEMIATAAMRDIGEIPPALFIHGKEGKAIFRPKSMSNVEEKNRFAEDSRAMCIAQGADAAVFCSEAWMRTPKADEKLDVSIAPSQAPDRQEVLILMGESRTGHIHKTLPILRAADGKFAGFGEATEIRPDNVEGRFSQFLPEQIPSEDDRKIAMLYLATKGIVPMEKKDKHRGHGRSRF